MTLIGQIYAGLGGIALLWYLAFAPSSTLLTSSSVSVKAKRRGSTYIIYTGGYRYGK